MFYQSLPQNSQQQPRQQQQMSQSFGIQGQQQHNPQQFPQELGLINRLVGHQQQQGQLSPLKQAQMALQQNGAHHQQHQRLHSADSAESSNTSEMDGSPSQSPAALISNLLAKTGGGGSQQQPRPMGGQQVNGVGPMENFANVHSQLAATYAGHFPEEMNNLFGSPTAAGSSAQQQFQPGYPPQQQPGANSAIGNGGQRSTIGTAASSSTGRRRTSELLKCSFCPKKFPGQAALQTHLEDCRQLRVHECPQCGKRFKARGGLQQHNRIHLNERPYHCHYCPKQFTQKSHVDQHERIHTGTKPFACQYCGRQFRQRSQQMGHETTHVNRERVAAALASTGDVSGVGLISRSLATLSSSSETTRMNGPRNSICSEQSSPLSDMAVGGLPGGLTMQQQLQAQSLHQQQRHQQQQQLGQQEVGGGGSASLAIAAAAAQHQMAFNGLLRAVGTGAGGLEFQQPNGNSSAVDSLLAMSASKQQQTGQELMNEQMRLMSR